MWGRAAWAIFILGSFLQSIDGWASPWGMEQQHVGCIHSGLIDAKYHSPFDARRIIRPTPAPQFGYESCVMLLVVKGDFVAHTTDNVRGDEFPILAGRFFPSLSSFNDLVGIDSFEPRDLFGFLWEQRICHYIVLAHLHYGTKISIFGDHIETFRAMKEGIWINSNIGRWRTADVVQGEQQMYFGTAIGIKNEIAIDSYVDRYPWPLTSNQTLLGNINLIACGVGRAPRSNGRYASRSISEYQEANLNNRNDDQSTAEKGARTNVYSETGSLGFQRDFSFSLWGASLGVWPAL
jgi:hypothetical protein